MKDEDDAVETRKEKGKEGDDKMREREGSKEKRVRFKQQDKEVKVKQVEMPTLGTRIV